MLREPEHVLNAEKDESVVVLCSARPVGMVKARLLHKKVTASILRDTFVVCSLQQGMPLADVLRKVGLSEQTWEDAKHKYERLASQAL